MIVKKIVVMDHVFDLVKVFAIIRGYEMHLNPKKCVSRVTSGIFLEYLVSFRGINANPKTIIALINIRLPRCVKRHM